MTPSYDTRVFRRADASPEIMEADVCVVGAGIAGVSAAIEAAKLGLSVILVDGGQALGGQSVGAMIGAFCGLYSNGPHSHRITHGIADEFLAHLEGQGALHYLRGRRNTTIVQYRVDAFGRWMDNAVSGAGVSVVLGALIRDVRLKGRRVDELNVATRNGDVVIRANGFVDASGDATLVWLAGLQVQQAEGVAIYGSMMLSLEGVNDAVLQTMDASAIKRRLTEVAADYGLVRRDGFAFVFPGAGETLVNMTHVETPLTATGYAAMVFEGRRQCDQLLRFLQTDFAPAFGSARVKAYGQPGIRQGRWIKGVHTLTVEQVRTGHRFEDAVARCSWPIEIHDDAGHASWEIFGDDHMHQVPLRSLLPYETDNLVAAGRCIDADVLALASVRVMGCCIAMGAAAAHTLKLAGRSSVHGVDIDTLQTALGHNLHDTP